MNSLIAFIKYLYEICISKAPETFQHSTHTKYCHGLRTFFKSNEWFLPFFWQYRVFIHVHIKITSLILKVNEWIFTKRNNSLQLNKFKEAGWSRNYSSDLPKTLGRCMFSIKLLFKGDEKGRKGRHIFFFKLGISLYFDTLYIAFLLKEVITV